RRAQEHHDLLVCHSDPHHHTGAAACRVPQPPEPAVAILSDRLFPAGDHAADPDVDRVEVDLRLQLRDPELSAVAGGAAGGTLADRSVDCAVGGHPDDRVEAAWLRHGAVSGGPAEYPAGIRRGREHRWRDRHAALLAHHAAAAAADPAVCAGHLFDQL